jgi:hypothetical protein
MAVFPPDGLRVVPSPTRAGICSSSSTGWSVAGRGRIAGFGHASVIAHLPSARNLRRLFDNHAAQLFHIHNRYCVQYRTCRG